MHLKKIALKRCNEPLEAWDPTTESWIPAALPGRIDLMDRFLSNFNKPTRRRMLFCDNELALPASRTIRHPGTKDVYIVGAPRQDARGGKPYLQMIILQLATDIPNSSGGYATVTRRVPMGPANDPGWLVDTVYAKCFVDTEFRTSSDEDETHDLKTENFLIYLPAAVEIRAWDFVTLHGHKYQVIDSFSDSGFMSGRIDERPDTRVDFVLNVEGAKHYDQATRKWVVADANYNVTGVILRDEAFALWSSEAEDYVVVYIDAPNIGVVPKANEMSLTWNGRTRIIRQVSTQAGSRQWELRCN